MAVQDERESEERELTITDTDEDMDEVETEMEPEPEESSILETLLHGHGVLDEVEGDDGESDIYENEGADQEPYTRLEVEIEDGNDSDHERTLRRRRYLMHLLRHSNLRDVLRHFTVDGIQDEDSESDVDDSPRRLRTRRRRQRPDPDRFPRIPSEEGAKLMNLGTFGSNETMTSAALKKGFIKDPMFNVNEEEVAGADGERENDKRRKKRNNLMRRILDRELATDHYYKEKVNQRLMAQGMIPSSNADMIIHYNQPVYSGQFSDDGNFFFSANKDYKVRMYDTSNPYKWRYYKTVEYPFGQWTLTDASLSPDNKYLAYTSIRSQVCLAPTDPNDMGEPYILDLADFGRSGTDPNSMFHSRWAGSFGIWSIRFSGDGKRLVAGATGGSIVLYDIESRQSLQRIFGHDADVNAVCFADKSSPHILYSGSDDTTLKVWDTRSMGDRRAAGAFIGHIEGLTYIDSKGDGRYILSNGKDQSMKLWDLRMVMASREFESIKPTRRATNEHRFDYRWGTYDEDDWYQDPNDNSVVTFRGHKVLKTLIRCHFSPPGSTNSRYVYSGSEDGKVYIYNMDATLAGKIDVYGATKNTRPQGTYDDMTWDDESGSRWKTCVRDASWHPSAPMIVASAFNGYGSSSGTCTVHSWNDGAEDDEAEPGMGLRVDPELEHDEHFYQTDRPRYPTRRAARIRVLRAQRILDEDD